MFLHEMADIACVIACTHVDHVAHGRYHLQPHPIVQKILKKHSANFGVDQDQNRNLAEALSFVLKQMNVDNEQVSLCILVSAYFFCNYLKRCSYSEGYFLVSLTSRLADSCSQGKQVIEHVEEIIVALHVDNDEASHASAECVTASLRKLFRCCDVLTGKKYRGCDEYISYRAEGPSSLALAVSRVAFASSCFQCNCRACVSASVIFFGASRWARSKQQTPRKFLHHTTRQTIAKKPGSFAPVLMVVVPLFFTRAGTGGRVDEVAGDMVPLPR